MSQHPKDSRSFSTYNINHHALLLNAYPMYFISDKCSDIKTGSFKYYQMLHSAYSGFFANFAL